MSFNEVIAKIKKEKLAAIRYQREGQGNYRDRVTVYYDGKIYFERFCYGEAAGLVLSMWGTANDELRWKYESCNHSQKEQAPKQLTAFNGEALFFDDKSPAWQGKEHLKTDSANGYSFFKMLLAK